MIDNSSKEIDNKIKDLINKDSIVLLNKSDIKNDQNHKFSRDIYDVSVKDNKNIDIFVKKLKEKLSNKFATKKNTLITYDMLSALNECLKEIDKFLSKDQNKDIELAAEDLRMATRHLGSTNSIDVEEILDDIFNDFCIGK